MGALDGKTTEIERPRVILVLGGAGFIGRHVVDALLTSGCQVIVGTRHPRRRQHRRAHAGISFHEIHLDRMLNADA